jgi:serine/threonine protein kinase
MALQWIAQPRLARGVAACRIPPVTLQGTLGRYKILEPVGQGGMGEVYAAEDTRLHRTVALKVLPRMLAADPERRLRFEREAQTIAALNHPNIVTIH